jgi:uncharacterized protein (DUF983 family)
MEGDAIKYSHRHCPRCGDPGIRLPMFISRRRRPVTCTSCGVKLERVLPGVAYYSIMTLIGLLTEVAALPLLFLVFLQQWLWIAVYIVALVAIHLGVSAFLNSRARVEFADPADARQDKPGRWYPE